MAVSAVVRDVFAHFQNLNLLALLHDLADEYVARGAWASSDRLCPVAHGLAAGQQVRKLQILGQAVDLSLGCAYAAQQLGASPAAVLRFVRSWDEETLGSGTFLLQLEELWDERLADAEAVQELLQVGAENSAAELVASSY